MLLEGHGRVEVGHTPMTAVPAVVARALLWLGKLTAADARKLVQVIYQHVAALMKQEEHSGLRRMLLGRRPHGHQVMILVIQPRKAGPLVNEDLHKPGVGLLELFDVLEGHGRAWRQTTKVYHRLLHKHFNWFHVTLTLTRMIQGVVEEGPAQAVGSILAIINGPASTAQKVSHHTVTEALMVGVLRRPQPLVATSQEQREFTPASTPKDTARSRR